MRPSLGDDGEVDDEQDEEDDCADDERASDGEAAERFDDVTAALGPSPPLSSTRRCRDVQRERKSVDEQERRKTRTPAPI